MVGFDEIPSNFPPFQSVRIQSKHRKFRKLLRWTGQRIEAALRRASAAGILGFVKREKERFGFSRIDGLLPLAIFHEDYFQEIGIEEVSPTLIRVLANQVKQGPSRDSKRGERFSENVDKNTECFVHVRRGDYLDWPPGVCTALPLDWFLLQMERIRGFREGVTFVIFGDDWRFLAEHFSPRPNCVVKSSGDTWTDFTYMASLPLGILSPSTYSWWAAVVSKANHDGYHVGPIGWTNWHGKLEEFIGHPSLSFVDLVPVSVHE